MSKIILTPSYISRLAQLNLRVKTIVEGTISGMHKSKSRGNSLEFYEHKQYSLMDEPKYIDWKIFARKEKLYLKSFTEEINLNISVLLDISNSMKYFSGNNVPKIDLAINLAASILYFAFMQNDYFGLHLFNSEIINYFPLASGEAYLNHLFTMMEDIKTKGKTDIMNSVSKFCSNNSKKNLLVIISDFLDEQNKIIKSVKMANFAKNDIILFQVLDRTEYELFDNKRYEIEDIETGEKIDLDINNVKADYQKLFDLKYEKIKNELSMNEVDFVRYFSDEPYDKPLLKYLAWRLKTVR